MRAARPSPFLLLLFFGALPLWAESPNRFHTYPATPVEGEPTHLIYEIEGSYYQPFAEPLVQRSGQVLKLGVPLLACSPQSCLPSPRVVSANLGLLEAGVYEVQLWTESIWVEPVSPSVEFDRFELVVAPSETAPVTLRDGRFRLLANWRSASGERGEARLVQPPSTDSALFYFFDPNNWELMVKVLDGCAINGSFWVFAAASTDVEFTVEIEDRVQERIFSFGNALGRPAVATTSINAFPCP